MRRGRAGSSSTARATLALLVPLVMVALAGADPGRRASVPGRHGGSSQARAHLDAEERRAIDEALRAASAFLWKQQRADGSLAPVRRAEVCPVALTAMAAWALARSAPPVDGARLRAALAFLERHRQPDGGLYDPERGLAVYTSGIAACALRAGVEATGDEALASALADLDLYVYRRPAPESWVDATADARPPSDVGTRSARLLADGEALSPATRRALEFLSAADADAGDRPPQRSRLPGWRPLSADTERFTYDDLLPFLYRPIETNHQIAQRAFHAVRASYTLDANPDLTRRYGPDGFRGGTQGIHYYYLVLAKTLAVRGVPTLETPDGARHDWVRELSTRLLARQDPAGFWVNEVPDWWEDEPTLVTAYAMLALDLCRGMPASGGVGESGR